MFAVIRTGGKQYKVAPEDVLQIEKIEGTQGEAVQFPEVLMVGGEGEPAFGTPLVTGAAVSAEVVEQGKGPKIIIFKKRRRQNYRRKNGHRQELTTVRILEIITGGNAATVMPGAFTEGEAGAKPVKARAKKPEASAEEGAPAPEAEVKKSKAAKPAAAEGAQEAAAAPKKPRAKKAE